MTGASKEKTEPEEKQFKDKFFKGLCTTWFLAVVAHTLNLQTEVIVLSKACGGDLAKTSRYMANSNAFASILGLIVNNFGGKLADSFGRKSFYFMGPLIQLVTGLIAYSRPDSALILVLCKALRKVFTTFSGTVIGAAALRDVFDAQSGELRNKELEARTRQGLAIMVGPLMEAMILKRVGAGKEHVTYLWLSVVGAVSMLATTQVPETLIKAKRAVFDLASGLQAANPLGFLKLYTHGSPALKKLATVITLQSVVDGKTMSDLAQIWMREHLKMSVSGIRNFIMGFGLASALSSDLVTKPLTKKMSVREFTTFTNLTNWLAFSLRGLAESPMLYFSMLPLMLPGVNGNSAIALLPILSQHADSCGFGKGEASAWMNNLRELAGAMATVIYGYFYAWARRNGVHAGHTYAIAGLLGAGIPQMLMMLLVKQRELEDV